MKIVAGLGNPGRRYEGTRHNVGFDVVARLVQAGPVVEKGGEKDVAWWRVELPVLRPGGASPEPVVLATPLSFMNVSGEPIGRLVAENGADPLEDLLVVVDDIALDPGRLRLRRGGSAGGHNGLRSIEARLGTRDYARLRLGVGQPPAGVPSEDWVLARPHGDDAKAIEAGVARAAEAVRAWLARGADRAMDEYNRVPAA